MLQGRSADDDHQNSWKWISKSLLICQCKNYLIASRCQSLKIYSDICPSLRSSRKKVDTSKTLEMKLSTAAATDKLATIAAEFQMMMMQCWLVAWTLSWVTVAAAKPQWKTLWHFRFEPRSSLDDDLEVTPEVDRRVAEPLICTAIYI